ncbi:MAG TPA: hypothetical protein VGX48_18730 [Pyrinomonadaceae bacterium]|jgi:hypothetical protein|nr:hypothetical protein [Pyrinomonadaceae bacterium]
MKADELDRLIDALRGEHSAEIEGGGGEPYVVTFKPRTGPRARHRLEAETDAEAVLEAYAFLNGE